MEAVMAEMTKPVNADDGYDLVKNLIFHQVHKFRRAYGGEFEDLLGEAHELFMKGHIQFERGTTSTGKVLEHSYATQIRYHVWFGLFDAMRLRLKRKQKAQFFSMDGIDIAAPQTDFRMVDFVAVLTPDGRVAAELVLNPPKNIETVAEGKGGTPRNYRSTVRQYLRDMGWEPDRINAAFAEITKALG